MLGNSCLGRINEKISGGHLPQSSIQIMSDNLPLNALRAFEAAARHKSFKAAAEELFVTPAAISQQIKSLEETLDVKLFHRQSRQITLTRAGTRGLAKVTEGFNCLTEAVQAMRSEDDDSTLTVWSSPSFAAKWLVPRLAEFTQANPGIDLDISADRSLIDSGATDSLHIEKFKHGLIDVAIRFGQGDYAELKVDKLFEVSAIPLCSPRLLTGEHPLNTPDDLRHQTLLHDATPYEGRPSWDKWLEAAGVEGIDAEHGISFNSVSMALAAAVDGQGVVYTLDALANDDIEAGRLVAPFDLRLPLDHAYYMITLAKHADKPKVARFCEWLLEQAHISSEHTN